VLRLIEFLDVLEAGKYSGDMPVMDWSKTAIKNYDKRRGS
jgi:hypothetical protein